jgi:hypothetical protein
MTRHACLVHAIRKSDEEVFYGFLHLPGDVERWRTICVLVSAKGEIVAFILDLFAKKIGAPPTGAFAQRCWINNGKLVWNEIRYFIAMLKGTEEIRGASHTISTAFANAPRWKALHPRAGQFAPATYEICIRQVEEVNETFITEYRGVVHSGWAAFHAKHPGSNLKPYLLHPVKEEFLTKEGCPCKGKVGSFTA